MVAYAHQFVYTTKKLPVLFIVHPALKNVVVHRHWHDDVELNYTISDTIDDFSIEDEHFTTSAGRILLVNSRQVHGVQSKQSSADGQQPAALTIVFPLPFLKDCYPSVDQIQFDLNHPDRFTDDQKQAYHELQRLLNKIMGQFGKTQNELTVLKIRTYLMMIITTLVEHFSRAKVYALPQNTEKQLRISTITEYMYQHYQAPLKIDDIAKNVHLSKEYLIRFFKNNLGTTPYQYLAYIRCQKAQGLLLHSEDNLTEIAVNTGFGSLRSMNRAFEKFVHTNAKNWRIKNQASQ